MIIFSDDNDQAPDNSGEYTRASLTKPDMPKDFTVCAAYMFRAFDFRTSAYMLQLNGEGDGLVNIYLKSQDTYTQFRVNFPWESLFFKTDRVLFPFTWTRLCLSMDTVTGNIRFVVDGEVLGDKVHKEFEQSKASANLTLELGGQHETPGIISQVNIFSSPMSTARMVTMTSAGGEECGAPGDYFSWEEEDWKLTSQARMEMVGELEAPCRKESEVTVYTAEFLHHSAATNPGKPSGCMEHCKKLGDGRSPSVQTLEKWNWLKKEVRAITPDISVFGPVWLAATDEEVEEEWRDAYPPYEHLKDGENGVAWPWWSRKIRQLGDTYNCLHWDTHRADEKSWKEHHCKDFKKTCPKDVS